MAEDTPDVSGELTQIITAIRGYSIMEQVKNIAKSPPEGLHILIYALAWTLFCNKKPGVSADFAASDFARVFLAAYNDIELKHAIGTKEMEEELGKKAH